MHPRFGGKNVVVTGGNSGIGLATAKAFAAEGAHVAIVGRNAKTLEEARTEIGGDTVAIQYDMADIAGLAGLVDQLVGALGRIDVLYANAGIASVAPFETVDEALWDSLFAINLKSNFFLVQKIAPHMPRGSAIVLCASLAGVRINPALSVYGITKAALRHLGRTLAAVLLPRGIRVNTVTPGLIATPLTSRTPGGGEDFGGDEILKSLTELTPMKRAGSVEEAAQAVLYLASDEAGYMLGQEIVIDGGVASLG
ncbi:SDR family oxidoreductase [Nitrospirillum sp. BR 11163]|uniref:SDR family oxidoreductase n=1 Tax=Nitrospirillum sp. BR 11163 TaxID=3104323 RepID=UPI002AFF76D0|nr:SDR family oxidoreductase [Nitrospirillum sp. BR 11163]MEA1672805.1 SDR family oxidoreductase [Nitrospirillum sp. BR 11163]